MTLRESWKAAKKDSETKFGLACKAYQEAAWKKANEKGDKAKLMKMALAEAGIVGSDTDVDRYFKFKEDLGPDLDKLEAAAKGNAAKRNTLSALTLENVLSNSAQQRLMEQVAKERYFFFDYWDFITRGYKLDPAEAFRLYIGDGAECPINVSAPARNALLQLKDRPAELKARGRALFEACRRELIVDGQLDVMNKFRSHPAVLAALRLTDVSALKAKVKGTINSYRTQINGASSKWSTVQPNFRQPLLDALTNIERSVDAVT